MTADALPSTVRRDAAVISVVSGAHLFSHFYMMMLPPLFPVMRTELGLSATSLGAILTTYSVASGVCQYFMGQLVDRIGATIVLIGGLVLLAGGFGMMGVLPVYWIMLPLAALAGIGNSVFHPADYTILGNTVSEKRMGRAFGIHTFSGWIGWALAPICVVAIDHIWGWRAALALLGLLGILYAIFLYSQRHLIGGGQPRPQNQRTDPAKSGLRLVFSLPILCMLVFFIVTASATNGLFSFLPTLMVDRGFTRDEGAWMLVAYVAFGAFGVLAGGFLADRVKNRELIPSAGLLSCGVLLTVVAAVTLSLPAYLLVFATAGFVFGIIAPSRDLIVRSLAPPGKSGQVFGFVSTGLDIGGATMPLVFGILIDAGLHDWVFYLIAMMMLVALAASWLATGIVRRHGPVAVAAE